MSTVTFRHEFNKSFQVKGVKQLIKESLLDGAKGLSFVLTKKEGEKFHRIQVKEISKDKFSVKEKINDNETTNEISMVDLKKMIKANKNLLFVKEYLESDRSKYGGSIKKVTRESVIQLANSLEAGAKKGSKKGSRQKKGSKKGTQKKN
jgi:hypothetical protein